MAKRVGKGIFVRSKPWESYHAEKDGYTYWIVEVKNFHSKRGWKIPKNEGGHEWVYVLMRRRKGMKRYTGIKAYGLYKALCKERHEKNSPRKINSWGYDVYTVNRGKSTKEYWFSFEHSSFGKSWEYDEEKTKVAILYIEEIVSSYFSSFKDCLKYAEEKLLSDKEIYGEKVRCLNEVMYGGLTSENSYRDIQT